MFLIRVYAQEGLVESMGRLILEAFKQNTMVTTSHIMRLIISGYFQFDALDRLAGFIRRAEYLGWRLCQSLYHCKMVMYGQQNLMEEMHAVLDEMEVFISLIAQRKLLLSCSRHIGRRGRGLRQSQYLE